MTLRLSFTTVGGPARFEETPIAPTANTMDSTLSESPLWMPEVIQKPFEYGNCWIADPWSTGSLITSMNLK